MANLSYFFDQQKMNTVFFQKKNVQKHKKKVKFHPFLQKFKKNDTTKIELKKMKKMKKKNNVFSPFLQKKPKKTKKNPEKTGKKRVFYQNHLLFPRFVNPLSGQKRGQKMTKNDPFLTPFDPF